MKPDRIIKALRCCSNPATRKPDCESCPLHEKERLCVKIMLESAADCIESLQNQLAAKETVNQCYSATVDLIKMEYRSKLQGAVAWADLLRESMAEV